MSFKSIGDYVELQRGTTYKSALLDQEGPYLLGLGSIARDGGFRSEKLRTYGGPSADKLLVYPGDMYVSLKDVTQSGDLLGSVARVPDTVKVGRMTQDTVKLCFKSDISKEYFYWILRSPQYRQHCRSHATGTTNLGLSRDDFFSFVVPELTISREKITNVLEDIESKINLNSQTNQTLEQMVQAIFKSWFVDFDPVKAKMNGEQPEGMDAATATLFPEKLVESEFGLIPEGWNAVQVGDIVKRLKPKKRYTKKQVEPYGKTPVYEQGASILLGFHNDDAGFDASPEDPVFIFGDHTCITHLSCSKFDISSNVIPLKGSVRPTIWTYYAIQGKQEFQEYRRHWSEFIIKDVVLPSVELAEKYAELVTTKYLMMESLKRQSKELEQLRDTLLPKLLSGGIDLGETNPESIKEDV